MTEQKMSDINKWIQNVDKNKLEMQEKLVIAQATMEMLEKIESIYDKYNQGKENMPGMARAFNWRIRKRDEQET